MQSFVILFLIWFLLHLKGIITRKEKKTRLFFSINISHKFEVNIIEVGLQLKVKGVWVKERENTEVGRWKDLFCLQKELYYKIEQNLE